MPKKKSSKATTKAEAEEASVVERAKPSSTPKKASNEIDEIFSGKKRKKPEKLNESEAEKQKLLKKKKKKAKEDKEGRFTDPPSKLRKKTGDGFSLYTEEELGISNSNAGGTPLCPFDCDCCF